MMALANRINELKFAERSPEKAGVGGSIPSLATLFSSTYQQPGTCRFIPILANS